MTVHRLRAAVVAVGVLVSPGIATGQSGDLRPPAPTAAGSGWLGIRSTATVQFGADGPVRSPSPLRIVEVFDGGPADRAGLRPGDLVVAWNGAPIDPTRFRSLADRLEPGDPVSLTIRREDREFALSVTASRRPGLEVIVPARIQEALDSTRTVFVARLDSAFGRLSATARGSVPAVRLGRIEAEPVHLRRIDAEAVGASGEPLSGPPARITVRTGDGVARWVAPEPGPADTVARAFTAWIVRHDEREGDAVEPATVLRVRATPIDTGSGTSVAPRIADEERALVVSLPDREAPAVSVARSRVTGSIRVPREPEEPPARPLAPYRVGLDRVAGARLTTLTPDLALYFEVDDGLLVTDIAEGTPAASAGLRPGDVIVEAEGRHVTSIETLRAALTLADGAVLLAVVRRGETRSVRLPR